MSCPVNIYTSILIDGKHFDCIETIDFPTEDPFSYPFLFLFPLCPIETFQNSWVSNAEKQSQIYPPHRKAGLVEGRGVAFSGAFPGQPQFMFSASIEHGARLVCWCCKHHDAMR